jgi:hypothetical protein
MQPRNEKFLTLFSKAGSNVVESAAILVESVAAPHERWSSGELIALLTTITDAGDARAGELASAYHQRWEEETANDQLKTHLRGPGRLLRSPLPDLVHQEIWA